MAVNIPKQLFSKAADCGLQGLALEDGNHCIKPDTNESAWSLTYQKGSWVLAVEGTPQVLFSYKEAMRFPDPFS